MGILSAIATGVAYKRYQTAKAEYESLLAKRAAMQVAVDTYNQNAYTMDFGGNKMRTEYMPGVEVSSIVSIENIGKNFIEQVTTLLSDQQAINYDKLQMQIVMSNTSKTNYYIQFVAGAFYLFGTDEKDYFNAGEIGYKSGNAGKLYVLKAGETLAITLPEVLVEHDERLTEKLGNPLKKTIVEGAIKSNITIMWQDDKTPHSNVYVESSKGLVGLHRMYIQKKPGVLYYRGLVPAALKNIA